VTRRKGNCLRAAARALRADKNRALERSIATEGIRFVKEAFDFEQCICEALNHRKIGMYPFIRRNEKVESLNIFL
jgi:hypothetical protein